MDDYISRLIQCNADLPDVRPVKRIMQVQLSKHDYAALRNCYEIHRPTGLERTCDQMIARYLDYEIRFSHPRWTNVGEKRRFQLARMKQYLNDESNKERIGHACKSLREFISDHGVYSPRPIGFSIIAKDTPCDEIKALPIRPIHVRQQVPNENSNIISMMAHVYGAHLCVDHETEIDCVQVLPECAYMALSNMKWEHFREK